MEKYTEYWEQICRLNEKILPLEYEISQLKKERQKALAYFRMQVFRGKLSKENYEKLLTITF